MCAAMNDQKYHRYSSDNYMHEFQIFFSGGGAVRGVIVFARGVLFSENFTLSI